MQIIINQIIIEHTLHMDIFPICYTISYICYTLSP